jgi:hypothetical protein
MTNRPKDRADLLPDDLLWADGGHASDVVLTAMADGELSIVPAQVRAHVEACRACTSHLGGAALLSLHAGRELALLAKEGDASARVPLPRFAIAAGLGVAFLGLIPSLMDPSGLRGAYAFATHDLPMFASGFGTLVRRLLAPGTTMSLVLTYGSALLLVCTAIALVRLLPKKEPSR